MKRRSALTPALLLALSACQEPLKDPQRIEEPRVLGVRVATMSDSSSIAPGQPAELQVLLVGPEGPLAAQLAYTFCEAAESAHGVPFCNGETLASGTVALDGTPLSFDVPASVPEGAHLALLAVACPQSEPLLERAPLDSSCAGGETPLRLSFDAWTAATDFANQNPDLDELNVFIGGTPVPLDDLESSPSCDAGAVEVPANVTRDIELVLGAKARESGESLQLSHFATNGLLERQYSFIEPDQAPEASLEWQTPSAGTAIKQYLVVRDGRGGVTFASFSVCAR